MTFIVSITACRYQRNERSQVPRFNGYHKNLSHLLINVIAKCTDQMQDKGASTCTNGVTFIALIFSIKLLLLQKCIGHKRNMRTTWRSKYSCFSLWISLRQSSISPSSRESKLNADSHLILQLFLIIRWGRKYCIHEGNDSTFIGGEGRGVVREITQNEVTMLWSDWLRIPLMINVTQSFLGDERSRDKRLRTSPWEAYWLPEGADSPSS